MKYSIVIPIYNTPIPDIENLIHDLSCQDIKDYEVILVDDGSDITISEYIDSFNGTPEIKIVHKSNEGVSVARNIGIKESRGEYIIFIDSDDRIPHNCLNIIDSYITKYEPDILFGQIIRKRSNVELDKPKRFKPYYIIDKDDAIRILLGAKKFKKYTITGSPCANVYKRTLLKEESFSKKLKLYEDYLFNFELLLNCSKILVIDDVLYYYNMNDYSATHGLYGKKYDKLSYPFIREFSKLINYLTGEAREEVRVFNLRLFYRIVANTIKYQKASYAYFYKMYNSYMEQEAINDIKNLEFSIKCMSLMDYIKLLFIKHNAIGVIFILFKFRYGFRRIIGVKDYYG
ncbi:glycosyltransferase family A protein [Butyrivibrio sp. M55]|uniref:glycosyltransferase family A protein n=1 Tax=Butyrivibrio sp. M55 TaxID=1855323 RepID=UPI0008ED1827|nr:glycosyltransferase family A protein [Butyrivibrio sp. M55]SFU54597.1 Glycosyl transferase family 2 [Butyrivibrio sp. M55]